MTNFSQATLKCITGKNVYLSKAEARERKRFEWRKYRQKKKFYECPSCGYYHLTSQQNELNQPGKLEKISLFREIARWQIQNKHAKFINRISDRRTAWEVMYNGKWYAVIYSKKTKKVKLL